MNKQKTKTGRGIEWTAKQFNVSQSTISLIAKGKTWQTVGFYL